MPIMKTIKETNEMKDSKPFLADTVAWLDKVIAAQRERARQTCSVCGLIGCICEETFKEGDLVRFREPQSDYERSAVFIVLEPRGPRTAVKDSSLMHSEHRDTLLAQSWTVYATADLERVK
jgi:hypothetical protein